MRCVELIRALKKYREVQFLSNRLDIDGNPVSSESPAAHLPLAKGYKVKLMHDWVLNEIRFDWRSARAVIELNDSASVIKTVIAEGVSDLHVPRMSEWGGSVSVNKVFEIKELTSRLQQLKIEMQSGDVIQIIAKQFILPSA